MRNPLNKRLPRELKKNWKKYGALFMMLTFIIGFVAGMYIANGSMEIAAAESFGKYNVEDGHFELKDKASAELLAHFEEQGIRIVEQFYKDQDEDHDRDGVRDGKIRIFKMREEMNRASLHSGAFPASENEIVIDRMHGDNCGIKVGDMIRVGDLDFTVSGLVAFSDYSALFEKASDTMFDAITFNIAAVSPEGYDRIQTQDVWQYAFQYAERPAEDGAKKEKAEDLVEKIAVLAKSGGLVSTKEEADQNEVIEFVPEYANQAIHFAISDFGSDKAMGEVLMDIFIVVLAFIFALTTSSTITEEAAVIGTLRTSGYSRGEMLRHYAAPTVLVTLLAALIGNILGYTVLKDSVVGMYYNSYSLPVYETRWSEEALVKTTLIPVGIMLCIVCLIILRKLRLSPLRFLRRDLSRSKRSKALRLPRWSFFTRFRLRIFLQNFGSYLTLILGIFFVMVLLAFAVGLPATLEYEKEEAGKNLLAEYQTILKSSRDEEDRRITTAEPSAEPFSITSLKTIDGVRAGEEISVYGYGASSRYFKLPDAPGEGKAYVSGNFAGKFRLKSGQSITLKDKYGPETYTFTIAGIYELPASMALLLPQAEFNRIFDREEGDFSGYLSEKALSDIPEKEIATVITIEDVLKMANQMDHSFGGFMTYFSIICMGIAFLLIFLLTKLIIEKNAISISMVKVLGYENGEVSALYVRLTTWIVILASVLSALLSIPFLSFLWGVIMQRMNGWFGFHLGGVNTVKIILMLVASYLLVAFFDLRRIKKIPLTDALKNVE